MENLAKDIKKYSIDDYYNEIKNLDYRTELRNSEIVALASPSIKHQRICGEIFFQIKSYIKQNNGKCQTFISPTDVKLNDNNIVIPDIFVTCNPQNFDNQKYNGSPDLIMEVVSTNWADDYIRKLSLYQECGVREYWIVDPKTEKITVYFFEENFIEVYSFNENIPVNIYKDNLSKLEININDLIE